MIYMYMYLKISHVIKAKSKKDLEKLGFDSWPHSQEETHTQA